MMANEDKKDFNAMLHDSKDMPKYKIITDSKSIEKYGGSNMYFAPPIDYDAIMRKVPYGKVITVGDLRAHFAQVNHADFTEPITAGIFVSIAAWASYQRSKDETPYWRTKSKWRAECKIPRRCGSAERKAGSRGPYDHQKRKNEFFRYFVKEYAKALYDLNGDES